MSKNSGGGGGQPPCTTVPLGKSVRRALRAAIGRPKRKDKPPKKKKPNSGKDSSSCASMELSGSSVAAARREAVVRVVLRGGVVEVYPGVVLACTVIRNHPPGLCLAHPDVFRNPHGAVVRPLEPLFPGQKFLLIPWSTVDKLKQRIPESSIGAFGDDDDQDEEEEEEFTSTEASSDDHSGDAASEEEERDGGGGGSSRFTAGCSAREFYQAQERWSACRFQRLVEQGLAVAPSKDEPADKDKDKATRKKKGTRNKRKGPKKRRDRPAAPLAGLLRTFMAPRRAAWEPSLPSVEEEEDDQEAPEDAKEASRAEDAHGQQ